MLVLQGRNRISPSTAWFLVKMILFSVLLGLLSVGAFGQINFEEEGQNPEENSEKAFPWHAVGVSPPEGFPLELSLTHYKNWARDIITCYVWTAYPKNGDEVVAATNWAMVNKYYVHASGSMRTWSPFTLAKTQNHPHLLTCGRGNGTLAHHLATHQSLSKVILLKTHALNKMHVSRNRPGDSYFWTEPGVMLGTLAQELEDYNLSLHSLPRTGNVTIGGVLAFGGHGTGVSKPREELSKGHTTGSLSNLIISFTAVVYNGTLGEYVLKDFKRSNQEAKAFMVNLGRTFVTNFTLRAGPLQYLRCRSYVDIPASSFFAASEGRNSASSLLNQYGRVEATLYPFTKFPWIKTWSVERFKPRVSREVQEPYNYPFTDFLPESISLVIKAMVERRLYNFTRLIGITRYITTVTGLAATKSSDIWGPSKNTLLYVRPTTLRYNAKGFAVLTARSNFQRVVFEVYDFYKKQLHSYEARGLFPINGPLEMRVTGLDKPEDVLIERAQTASMSTLRMVDGSDFDTAVWFTIASYLKTPSCDQFMSELENFVMRTFDGEWALGRAEWAKGWAYTREGPWKNKDFFLQNIKSGPNDESYVYFIDKVVEHDPHYVFTNEFTREYFV